MRKILPVLLMAALLMGCSASEPCAHQTVFCMDTVMDLQIWGQERQQAMDAIVEMLQVLESTWSATDENTFLSALNRGEGTPDKAQQDFLDQALALQERTGGAFDPKLGSVIALWGFYDDAYRVPTAQEITEAKTAPKWDLGALVKGYAGSRAVEILEQFDIDRAILNLGGNIQTYGEKENGTPWNIGVQNPTGGDALGALAIHGTMAVVTSGDYQRYFELDGVRYHHILDPKTGMSADSGLSSVTVICADGAVADALSTALFVMGLEEAIALWRQSDDFEAVFLLQDGTIYATEGASLSGCEYEVIRHEN